MSSRPRDSIIDVLIPVRAPAPWLAEALESVVRQTWASWRLIVVMDGYSDQVQAVCDALDTLNEVTVAAMPERSGLVSVLNRGIAISEAEFIARLDADDVCHPDRLTVQIDYMRRNPDCVALGTGVRLVSEDGTPRGARTAKQRGSVLRRLRWRSAVVHPSVMMRSDAVRYVGGYCTKAVHAEDFDLWLRLAQVGEVHALTDALLDYRAHGGQVTSGVKVPSLTRRRIGESRSALARSRSESVIAARGRQAMWVAANKLKGR